MEADGRGGRSAGELEEGRKEERGPEREEEGDIEH